MQDLARKPPTWFWIVSALALAWELVGVASYLMQAYGGGPAMQAEMTEAQLRLDASMPGWVMGAFAISVFSGLLGAIGLLIRKSWSKTLLLISLIAAAIQFGWVLLVSDAIDLLGGQAAILPIVIIVAGIFLVWFARTADRRGWLS